MKHGDFLIEKYNPYHAANGQFTTSGNAHYVNISIKRQNSGRQINVGEMLMREYKAKNQAAVKPLPSIERIKRPRTQAERNQLADKLMEGVNYKLMPSMGKNNRLYQSFNEGLIILRAGKGVYKDEGQYNAAYRSVLNTKKKIMDFQSQNNKP